MNLLYMKVKCYHTVGVTAANWVLDAAKLSLGAGLGSSFKFEATLLQPHVSGAFDQALGLEPFLWSEKVSVQP